MMHTQTEIGPGHAVTREAIHDLRNLFGIVASACHLLGDEQTAERRTQLLEAIENAALRGDRLTTGLLASTTPRIPTVEIDVNTVVLDLHAMIEALVGRDVRLSIDLAQGCSRIRVNLGTLEAAVLELVTNARAACRVGDTLTIRTRRVRGQLWISIADTGRGMDATEQQRALGDFAATGAHGTGVGRVRQFAKAAGGYFRLRSRPGRGTIATVILPTTLTITAARTDGKSAKLSGHARAWQKHNAADPSPRSVKPQASIVLAA